MDGIGNGIGTQADKRWRELDTDCRLPQDLYDAALDARLFRTLVPTQLGGINGTPLDWFRMGVALATREPSFGWVITQGAVELGWIAAAGDREWAIEVLSDPKAACASSVAGLGELKIDGTKPRFGGRWNFNSGVHGATWIGGLRELKEHGMLMDRPIFALHGYRRIGLRFSMTGIQVD